MAGNRVEEEQEEEEEEEFILVESDQGALSAFCSGSQPNSTQNEPQGEVPDP